MNRVFNLHLPILITQVPFAKQSFPFVKQSFLLIEVMSPFPRIISINSFILNKFLHFPYIFVLKCFYFAHLFYNSGSAIALCCEHLLWKQEIQ